MLPALLLGVSGCVGRVHGLSQVGAGAVVVMVQVQRWGPHVHVRPVVGVETRVFFMKLKRHAKCRQLLSHQW